MFKRLRIRFIALSMASLLLVLLVILGAVNIISYRHVVQDADEILDVLAAGGGSFPRPAASEETDETITDMEPPALPDPGTLPGAPESQGQSGVMPDWEAPQNPADGGAAPPAQPAEGESLPWQTPDVNPVPATDGEWNPVVTPPVAWNAAPDEGGLSAALLPLDADDDDLDEDDAEGDWDEEDGNPAPPPAARPETDTSDNQTQTERRDRTAIRSKEMPYESRYFTVTVNDAGDVLNVDTGKIAAVDMEQAVEFAETALSRKAERGFVDDYRYLITDTDEGQMLLFLDCGRNLTTFRSFRTASLLVSAGGIAAVFLLILAFSGRIVRPVAESYEKQKRFITDAGHEIKTPLAIIEADADVLEMELEGESEWLQDIRTQTRRLTDLTNDLVYLSRMEERTDERQLVEFPFSDVVEETAQSFRSRAMQKQVTFTDHIEPMLSLKGDEKALRQLTSILLDNAVKYAPVGGDISLTLERQGRGAALTVFNTSSTPVPRESLTRLFDRFYRTDPSRSSATGGHGIGLSIARAVVMAHKGRITAETADEQSLKMTVWLPMERSARAE